MDKIAAVQQELLDQALEKWKNTELKKITEEKDNYITTEADDWE